jgi:hypothetical protein
MMRSAFIDRRKFLQWGALGGVLVAAGCTGGDGTPQAVTTPPVDGGNRKLLKKIADTAESNPKAKPKKK